MKRIVGFLLLLSLNLFTATTLLAQSGIVAANTQKAARVNQVANYDLFTVQSVRDAGIDAAIEDVIYLKLNREQLALLLQNKSAALSFELPLDGTNATILLGKTDIFSEDFSATAKGVSGSLPTEKPQGLFYRGYEQSHDKSIAALSFFKDQMGGIISIPGVTGNYNLTLNYENPGSMKDNYILYKENNIKNADKFVGLCEGGISTAGADNQNEHAKALVGENGLNCHIVTMAMYGDYKLFLKNAGSMTATQEYLTIVFNGIATLYENDGIRLALKYINVNTAPDGYPTTSSHDVLYQFGDEIQTDVTADLMQLFTGHTTTSSGGTVYAPLGGVAWLDVLCHTPAYYPEKSTYYGPFSVVNTMGNPDLPLVPVYSWDIECSAHELGHNFGSPHTHACYWNGDNTAIDGCAPTYDSTYWNPDCEIGPVPSSTVKGTIMSYCHLLSSVGINLANGFGPQPGDLIRNKIAAATCLMPEFMPTIVLNHPDSTIYANAFCREGYQIFCYDNRNDFDRSNDRLILIITASAEDSLDLDLMEISMTTGSGYGSNTGIDATAFSYLNDDYESWFHCNRSWNINLNQPLPEYSYFGFPFLKQDLDDLSGSYPSFAGSRDSVRLVVFQSESAAGTPAMADESEVRLIRNGSGPTYWDYNSNWYYKLATIRADSSIRGATFGVGREKIKAGVSSFSTQHFLKIFPNPATDQLHISMEPAAGLIRKIEIVDHLGRVVLITEGQTSDRDLDIAHIPSGLYLVKCITNQTTYIHKFVKL